VWVPDLSAYALTDTPLVAVSASGVEWEANPVSTDRATLTRIVGQLEFRASGDVAGPCLVRYAIGIGSPVAVVSNLDALDFYIRDVDVLTSGLIYIHANTEFGCCCNEMHNVPIDVKVKRKLSNDTDDNVCVYTQITSGAEVVVLRTNLHHLFNRN